MATPVLLRCGSRMLMAGTARTELADMAKNNGLRQRCDRMMLRELANPEVLPNLRRSLRLWSHVPFLYAAPHIIHAHYQDSKKGAYDTKRSLVAFDGLVRSRIFEAGKTRLTNAGCSVWSIKNVRALELSVSPSRRLLSEEESCPTCCSKCQPCLEV